MSDETPTKRESVNEEAQAREAILKYFTSEIMGHIGYVISIIFVGIGLLNSKLVLILYDKHLIILPFFASIYFTILAYFIGRTIYWSVMTTGVLVVEPSYFTPKGQGFKYNLLWGFIDASRKWLKRGDVYSVYKKHLKLDIAFFFRKSRFNVLVCFIFFSILNYVVYVFYLIFLNILG